MSTQLVDIYEPELQRRFFEDFGRGLFKESIIGQEPSTTLLGLDPVSRSTPKTYWVVVYPKSGYKIMDPISSHPPPTSSKNLHCNSVTN